MLVHSLFPLSLSLTHTIHIIKNNLLKTYATLGDSEEYCCVGHQVLWVTQSPCTDGKWDLTKLHMTENQNYVNSNDLWWQMFMQEKVWGPTWSCCLELFVGICYKTDTGAKVICGILLLKSQWLREEHKHVASNQTLVVTDQWTEPVNRNKVYHCLWKSGGYQALSSV